MDVQYHWGCAPWEVDSALLLLLLIIPSILCCLVGSHWDFPWFPLALISTLVLYEVVGTLIRYLVGTLVGVSNLRSSTKIALNISVVVTIIYIIAFSSILFLDMYCKNSVLLTPSSLTLSISHEGTTNITGIQPALTKQPVLQPPLLQILVLLA